ncbi:serine/threonine-protein kinase [Cohnella phaseoli]|uniref:Serine/threonine protein kinase n=1 Tax=Cohnella phaseoli TaxID=456490 RepID=A0A3D9KAV7_9BACL|nr:serine/threonine-protein kinase [Cohnella phaseoli]RED83280.1 serine/threonine protein kinase [Cohnella phaseoli]
MDMRVSEIYFELISEIGQEGLNSKTHIARDIQLDATLVIKEINKSDIPKGTPYFTEARFLYESRHPNVMEIHYASQDADKLYLAMPYYKKGSLNSVINNKFLSIPEIIHFGLDFLSALHFIHSKGLIHFDVKPSNIIINDAGKALLTDFGLAGLTNRYGFATVQAAYPTHLTPEIFQAGAFTVQYDVFQAGLTLYRMCNGNADFDLKLQMGGVTQEEVLRGTFPDRNTFLPHIPDSLRAVVKKALKVHPDQRYKSIIHMMNDLASLKENLNWSYSYDPGTGRHQWVEDTERSTRTLVLFEDNRTWKTEGSKYTKASQNVTRVPAWFTRSATMAEAFNKVKQAIDDSN